MRVGARREFWALVSVVHPEKAMVLAKESLMDAIDIQELQARGAKDWLEELRLEIFSKVNALGIGAQGLGGLTHSTGYKNKTLSYPRRFPARCHDPQLRRDTARTLLPERVRPCRAEPTRHG